MNGSLTDDEVRAQIATVAHWYHRIEVRPGIVTPGINDSPLVLRQLRLPDDCRNLRVLDLGTRDGYFAFELERRGAEVLAVDYMPLEVTGFSIASRLVGSRVRYLHENLYNLNPDTIGTFDLVLFLGLLYHLPDPIRALRIVRSLSRSRMILETLVIDDLKSVPIMRFFPGDSLGGDPSNYWGPNVACVRAMLAETEFAVARDVQMGDRALFDCGVITNPHTSRILAESSGRAVK